MACRKRGRLGLDHVRNTPQEVYPWCCNTNYTNPKQKNRVGHQGLIMGVGSYVLCDLNTLTYGYHGIVVNVKGSDVGVES